MKELYFILVCNSKNILYMLEYFVLKCVSGNGFVAIVSIMRSWRLLKAGVQLSRNFLQNGFVYLQLSIYVNGMKHIEGSSKIEFCSYMVSLLSLICFVVPNRKGTYSILTSVVSSPNQLTGETVIFFMPSLNCIISRL